MISDLDSRLAELEENIPISPKNTEVILRSLLETTQDSQKRLNILKLLGYSLITQSRLIEAKDIYFEVYDSAIKSNFIELEAEALNGLAMIESELGELQKAEIHAKNAMSIFQKLGIPEKEAKLANILGVIFFYQHKYDESLKYLQSVSEKLMKSDPQIEIQTLANLGLVCMIRNQLRTAQETFQKALHMAKEHHFYHWVCMISNNLAETEFLLGNTKDTKQLYHDGLNTAQSIQDRRSLALLKVGYAHFLIEIGEIDRASDYLKSSLRVYKDIDDPIGYLACLYRYAEFWMYKGQLIRARDSLLEALHFLDDSDVNQSNLDIYIFLAEIEYWLGNLDKAYENLKIADILSRNQGISIGRCKILILRAKFAIEKANYFEAEFLISEASQIASENEDVEMQVKCSMLECQIYFKKMFETKVDLASIEGVKLSHSGQSVIEQALDLTKKYDLLYVSHHIRVIKALIAMLFDDNAKAEKTLRKVLAYSHDQNINSLENSVGELLSIVSAKYNTQEAQNELIDVILHKIQEKLQHMTRSFGDTLITPRVIDEISLVVYKIDEIVGPMVVEAINIDLKNTAENDLILHSGSLFSITLGQGQQYHQGLFGPLPFGESGKYALVYAQTIADITQKEKRTHGKAYFLFSVVYPIAMNIIFYDRQKLTQIFSKHVQKLSEARNITTQFLSSLLRNIIDEFLREES